jgi:hypothetical protein
MRLCQYRDRLHEAAMQLAEAGFTASACRTDLHMRAIMTTQEQRLQAAKLIAIGAICGLAWAASLRALMAEVAGAQSEVSWNGTFGAILAPGAVAGGLLGLAEHLRLVGSTRRGWLLLAPFAFVLTPGSIEDLISDGGAGVIAVPLLGIGGAYALTPGRQRWTRVLAGLVAAIPIPGWAASATNVGGADFALTSPRGAWVAIFLWSLFAVLYLACTLPIRPVERVSHLDELHKIGA